MTVYFFKDDMRNVTEFYYKVILEALSQNGIEIIPIQSCSFASARKIPHNSYILATTLKAFIALYLTGHRNFIFWYQGISPEEIYMMKGSKVRYWVDTFVEKLSLRKVRYKIGVSKYLFRHFEEKYKIQIDPKGVFIMPCYNSLLNLKSFYTPNKYENNVFCYAGGMQPWQGFEDIVKLYKQIEGIRPDVYLKVYSKDIERAKKIIDQANLKHYSIDCVPQEQMDAELSGCKFGFIIREDNVINNVATPTKLATYLGNGVIPIYSSTVWSFRDLASQSDFICCLDRDSKDLEKIVAFVDRKISPDDILADYTKLFEGYYNREKYIAELRLFFTELK